MADDDAWGWLTTGLALLLAGVMLLRLDDPFLFTLWGVGLALGGGAVALVGAGVLLRVWR